MSILTKMYTNRYRSKIKRLQENTFVSLSGEKRIEPFQFFYTPTLVESIELLLQHRKDMKITEKNPYVFGVHGEDKTRHNHLSACRLRRKFSVACGADKPERLRGTQLRKHIATTCVSMNLSENQVTDLANFMGHAEKIHKEIYRQPLVNREILKMSKLLEAAQGAGQPEDDDSHDDDEELEDNETNADFDEDETYGVAYTCNNTSETAIKSKRQKQTGSAKRKRSSK